MDFYSLKHQLKPELDHFIKELNFTDRSKIEIFYCSHCGNPINNQLNVHWFIITNPDLHSYQRKFCSIDCSSQKYLLDRIIHNFF